jgi:tyrosyl-tRNA synthetase
VPILPGIDGTEKMSKSLGNHIGVTEPPEEMYGRTLSLPDEAMGTWFAILGIDPPPAGTPPRDAKRALARAIVERFHGADGARAAEEHFDRVHIQRAVPDDVEDLEVSPDDGRVHIPGLLAGGFGLSRSDARRLLSQGGVRLDGEPLAPDELDLPADRLDGAVLQVGKRQFRRLRIG